MRSVAEELRAALDEAGISQRELARRLAGPAAKGKDWDRERRNVSRWTGGEVKSLSRPKAQAVATILRTDWQRFHRSKEDEDAFVAELVQRVADLEADRAQTLETLKQIGDRLGRLVKEVAGLRDDRREHANGHSAHGA